MRPGKDDHVILEKSMGDAEKGFATQPMSQKELVSQLGGKEFRLIRRFVITQSTGKQRIESSTMQPQEDSQKPAPTKICWAFATPFSRLTTLLAWWLSWQQEACRGQTKE